MAVAFQEVDPAVAHTFGRVFVNGVNIEIIAAEVIDVLVAALD